MVWGCRPLVLVARTLPTLARGLRVPGLPPFVLAVRGLVHPLFIAVLVRLLVRVRVGHGCEAWQLAKEPRKVLGAANPNTSPFKQKTDNHALTSRKGSRTNSETHKGSYTKPNKGNQLDSQRVVLIA